MVKSRLNFGLHRAFVYFLDGWTVKGRNSLDREKLAQILPMFVKWKVEKKKRGSAVCWWNLIF